LSDVYYVLLWVALWSRGQRASVVQAQRQIHRAPLGRPRRRGSFVAQGLVRPLSLQKQKHWADATARLGSLAPGSGLRPARGQAPAGTKALHAGPCLDQRARRPKNDRPTAAPDRVLIEHCRHELRISLPRIGRPPQLVTLRGLYPKSGINQMDFSTAC
jgi:hypothetical protein